MGSPIPEMDEPPADRAVMAKAIDADGMTEHAVLLLVLFLHVGQELSHGFDGFLAAIKLAMEWNQ